MEKFDLEWAMCGGVFFARDNVINSHYAMFGIAVSKVVKLNADGDGYVVGKYERFLHDYTPVRMATRE
jgi:hypothetical protein